MTDTPFGSLIFVSGTARSGKSEWAERALLRLARGNPKVYLATSPVSDEEMRARVARHQSARKGRGFLTVERERGLSAILPLLPPDAAILLESLTAWAANEMFQGTPQAPGQVRENILQAIRRLRARCRCLLIVSDDIFSDGTIYDRTTEAYRRLLGELHRTLALQADAAVECAAGLARLAKGRLGIL